MSSPEGDTPSHCACGKDLLGTTQKENFKLYHGKIYRMLAQEVPADAERQPSPAAADREREC